MTSFPAPFHHFASVVSPDHLPGKFTCPFYYHPHPLAVEAAEEVQHYLSSRKDWEEELSHGKMFGVLVVQHAGQTGFLAAFSGLLDGRNDHRYFVPPVYDLLRPDGVFKAEERKISGINRHIRALERGHLHQALSLRLKAVEEEGAKELSAARSELKAAKSRRDEIRASAAGKGMENELIRESQFLKAEYKRLERKWKQEAEAYQAVWQKLEEKVRRLKHERKLRSEALQKWLFAQFRLLNARGEEKDLWQIFREHGRPAPPSGAGECAAPKLLQYAYRHGLRPVAMAEFWWGNSPETEIRRHGQFYPACKSKCEPILGHMLQGLDVEPNAQETVKLKPAAPVLLYEDEWLAALDKPAGMLSVPGTNPDAPSVLSWARERYPQARGPIVVHRLDMDTSGILLLAKDPQTFNEMQQLFEQRNIQKTYVALLDGHVAADKGVVELPLRPNIDDRPRQMASPDGKPAVTRYQVLGREGGHTRVAFYPETGRTHQLRVHAAHPRGLNAPIVGDNLYGKRADRLYLHAESVGFTHPRTGKHLSLHAPVPF